MMFRFILFFIALAFSSLWNSSSILAFETGYGLQLRWGNIVDYTSVEMEGERVAIAWDHLGKDQRDRNPDSPNVSNLIVDSLMGPFNSEFDKTSRARFPIKPMLPTSKFGSFGLEWLWDYDTSEIFLMREVYEFGGPASLTAQCPAAGSYNRILGPHCFLSIELAQERIQIGLMATYTLMNSGFVEFFTFGYGRSFGQINYDLDVRLCYGNNLYSNSLEYYDTLEACHKSDSGAFPGGGTSLQLDRKSDSAMIGFTHYSIVAARFKGESWMMSIFEMEFFLSDPISISMENGNTIELTTAYAVSNYFTYTYLF